MLFLGLLVYAPWAYGCTVDWSITGLELIAAAILGIWLLGCLVTRKAPNIDRWNGVCIALLLGQGWLMALNAHSLFLPEYKGHVHVFVLAHAWWEKGPGTADAATSIAMMWRVTALLGLLIFACDLVRSPVWRKRVCWTMAIGAASMVLFGLFQRVLGAPSIFWSGKPTTVPFFGTFTYHGNAGAFINLVFPLAVAFAWLSCRDEASRGQRMFALPVAAVLFTGACVNTSRAAFAITFLMGCGLLAWMILRPSRSRALKGGRLVSGSVTVIAIATIAISAGWETALHKWSLLPDQLTGENPRVLAMWVCAKMLPDAGFWGFGPGTFLIAFPHYTDFLGRRIEGIWRFAHQDYLQAIIEWGFIGATVLGAIFVRGMVRAFKGSKIAGASDSERILRFATGLALLGVALHAVIDFPLQIASLQLYVVCLLAIAVSPPPKGDIVVVKVGGVVIPA